MSHNLLLLLTCCAFLEYIYAFAIWLPCSFHAYDGLMRKRLPGLAEEFGKIGFVSIVTRGGLPWAASGSENKFILLNVAEHVTYDMLPHGGLLCLERSTKAHRRWPGRYAFKRCCSMVGSGIGARCYADSGMLVRRCFSDFDAVGTEQLRYIFSTAKLRPKKTNTIDNVKPQADVRGTRRDVVLVDGSRVLSYYFHTIPMLHLADGTPVNAVIGYWNLLRKLPDWFGPETRIGVVFDHPGGSAWRRELYPNYRSDKQTLPPELMSQSGLVLEASRILDLYTLSVAGFGAHDVISVVAEDTSRRKAQTFIVSNCRLVHKLASPDVTIWNFVKRQYIDEAKVIEKYGLPPTLLGDYFSLIGYASDNVLGVRGIGPKTATKLLLEHGSLEKILSTPRVVERESIRKRLLADKDHLRINMKLFGDPPTPPTLERGFAHKHFGRIKRVEGTDV